MNGTVLDTALELHDAGYAVLPIRADGSKAPAVASWREYMTTPPTRAQVEAWFTGTDNGLAVIQGAISGAAELTELEGRAVGSLPELKELAEASGLGELWQRVTAGWLDSSPSGGIHLHYRLDAAVPGNTKIARDADRLVLAETRGEGGYVVVAPTPGTHHPSGRPWTRLAGSPSTAPVLTLDERDGLHSLLRTLDRAPARDVAAPTRPVATPRDPADGISPGDDYEAKVDWTEILTPHGWTHVMTRGRTRYWRRPGKNAGISATTGHADDRDRFFCFSSSTEFDTDTPYTKFGAYTLLHHGGDHSAAAKALAADGYGHRAERLRPATTDDLTGLIAPTETTCTTPTPSTTPSAPNAATPPADATTAPTSLSRPTANSSSSSANTAQSPHTSAKAQAAKTAPTSTTPAPGAGNKHSTNGTSALAPEPAPHLYIVPSGNQTVPDITRKAEPNQDNTALLLVDEHHDRIRHCAGRGTWLTWDGHRWATDEAETVRERARAIARRLPDGEGWARYRNSALSANGVGGILRLAQSDPRIIAPVAALDAQPYALNTPAGVVNLRTGAITAPDPTALHTRSTVVAPDFEAEHPLWTKFLGDTFARDTEMIAFIARALGLSLVGQVLEQVFFFAYGAGANGKTTLLSVVQHLVGLGNGGYAASAPAEMLLATRNHGHPAELARLSGQRITVTSELDDGQRFDEARIKQLTGKDTISARFMNRDWFDFTPTHTLWLLANHQPQVRVGGLAFWRRVVMIPFVHTVPEDQRIKDLEERLIREEGPAILAWVLRGAADYFARGLAIPEAVLAATTSYEATQDTVGQFVAECCETGSPAAQHLRVRSAELRDAYERWCTDEGVEPIPARTFTLTLKSQHGIESERSMSARYLAGIRLREASSDASSNSQLQGLLGDGERW